MAGGMNKRGQWGSMAERIAQTGGAPAPDAATASPPVKHCWVVGTDGAPAAPALLLQWRRTLAGYQGRVVYPLHLDEGWIVVEEWLPAERLRPAAAAHVP